ncbi:D-alanyl-D-alanine carboxypeptidase [Amylibacter marinus]|uniref:serine-type D-Ala-D-Ala carboxypeptidase n=1 Tax=Amylibacter marinus TaxID=1475483 RepID=A0ABQ5VRD3_9RHOB|nr:D-alanyl-D-alanine carboxypeptidase family protein [Amylibacter marinus]GLQ33972.1 D-alanyl-D-alanine carboxypeptidase [Amylibacter marinus]
MKFLSRIFCTLSATLMLVTPAIAFDTAATSAMIVDQTTGTVLLAKDADRPIPPASMSKLMTLNMLFEALRDGRVTMETKFLVSDRAQQIGGSTMFLRSGERVSVENLIQGIIVQSGNDACVTVAENLAGTEEAFAQQMTDRAGELGMNASSFGNATGWPHPLQRMSARDLVFMANRLITDFPQFYPYFSQQSFEWDGVKQDNRNPLLNLGIGADGLKTGHTSEAGYGLVGSAKQGKRRVIFMITGLQSAAERASEAEKLTNWAFRQFVSKELFKQGATISTAEVWLGAEKHVPLTTEHDIASLIPLGVQSDIQLSISYQGPIEAPIAKGDQIATLKVNVAKMNPVEFPLVAASDVEKGGVLTRMIAAAHLLSKDLIGNKLGAAN